MLGMRFSLEEGDDCVFVRLTSPRGTVDPPVCAEWWTQPWSVPAVCRVSALSQSCPNSAACSASPRLPSHGTCQAAAAVIC